MDLFNVKNLNINSNCIGTSISEYLDLDNMISILKHCYDKKITCVISDNSIKKYNSTNDIMIIYKSQIHYLTWDHLDKINSFFYDNYVINDNFNVTPCIFNIFMFKIIDRYFSQIDSTGISLISSSNAIFGIYNSYVTVVDKCSHYLYFSFKLFSFILYRVYDSDNHIVGRLTPQANIIDNSLIISGNKYKLPKSFIEVKKNIYALRKKKVDFNIDKIKNINIPLLVNRVCHYHKKSLIYNTYIITLKNNICRSILADLFKYILLSYPCLTHKNNEYTFDVDSDDNKDLLLGLYIRYRYDKKQSLIVQLNNRCGPYANHILEDIVYFLKNIESNNKIYVYPKKIIVTKHTELIHIVSEIYYMILCILFFLPKVFCNLTLNTKEDYIHANYIFNSKEVHTLFENKNKLFSSNIVYLQSILIKTLSINLSNKYCVIQSRSKINIIPIKKNMTTDTISNLIERGNKAELSKVFLWSMLNQIFKNPNISKFESPFIFININNLGETCIDMTNKIYASVSKNNIAIYINILVNNNSMHISISYKKKYDNFKNAFDVIISELSK